MSDFERPQLPTADELQLSAEWGIRPAETIELYFDEADEGTGHGFDDLDQSAFVRAYRWSPTDWQTVRDDYARALGELRWHVSAGLQQPEALWWQRRAGETFWLIRREPGPSDWVPSGVPAGAGTLFEVGYKVERQGEQSGAM